MDYCTQHTWLFFNQIIDSCGLLQVLKWNFTQPRSEFVEQLKEQMQNNISSAILNQMFHSDFKHHIKAIDSLADVCTA